MVHFNITFLSSELLIFANVHVNIIDGILRTTIRIIYCTPANFVLSCKWCVQNSVCVRIFLLKYSIVCVFVCSIELRPSILFHRMKAMQRKYRLLGQNCIYFHQHVLVYAKIHTGEKWGGRGRDTSDCEDNSDVLCVQISCRNPFIVCSSFGHALPVTQKNWHAATHRTPHCHTAQWSNTNVDNYYRSSLELNQIKLAAVRNICAILTYISQINSNFFRNC